MLTLLWSAPDLVLMACATTNASTEKRNVIRICWLLRHSIACTGTTSCAC